MREMDDKVAKPALRSYNTLPLSRYQKRFLTYPSDQPPEN